MAAALAVASSTAFAQAAAGAPGLGRPQLVGGSGGGPARIPTGQFITATAATGSTYQRLTTGLRPDGNADADSAMTSALSPDGKTLLVLTSGFNVSTNKQVPQTPSNPVPLLFPALNPLTGTDTPFTNPNGSFTIFDPLGNPVASPTTSGTQVNQAEFLFVFDVTGKTPKKLQQIYIPDTFDGLAWSHDGQRIFVSGGVDDRVLVYKAQAPGGTASVSRSSNARIARGGRTSAAIATSATSGVTTTYVPDAPFVILNHDDLDTQTFPLYDGGILKFSPLGQAALAPGAPPQVAIFSRLITGGIAAGVGVSNDGKTMVVANFEDASASIVDLGTRKVTSEVTFTPVGTTSPMNAKGEFPYWTVVKSDYQSGAFVKAYVSSYRDEDVMVVSPGAATAKEIKTCNGPNKMLLNGDGSLLYVACGNDDVVDVINTNSDIVTRTINLARNTQKYRGSDPDSLALSPDGATLYVTLGGENAVAVVDVASGTVRGRIPTGWLPTSVSVSADGKKLYVVNEKSNEGPNPGQIYYSWNTPAGAALNPTNANLYTWEGEKSGLLTIPVPDVNELSYLTKLVDANDGFDNAGKNDPVMGALRNRIQHVIYIVNENRTFDQVLGDLGNGSNGDAALTFFTRDITPNLHALAEDYVTLDNFYDSSETSGVGWNWVMQSHTDDFVEKTQPVQYGNSNGAGLTYDWQGIVMNINLGQPAICGANPTIFNCRITTVASGGNTASTILPGPRDPSSSTGARNLDPSVHGGYIWESALRAGKTVRNYGWQIDLNYYGTPLGPQEVRNPGALGIRQSSPDSPTIKPITDEYYRAFDQSYPDIYRVEEWQREFANYVKNDDLPNLMTMTIPHDHTGSFAASAAFSGLGTPQLELADHDYAIGKLVETLSHSKYWKSTAIVMLEDDPQDGQDHVEAHRSIIHIISPFTKSHFVDHTTYTSVNAIRTVEDLLGIGHLSNFDNNASPMSTAFTTSPNLQPYTPIIPGSLCAPPVHPDLVPECAGPKATSAKRTRAVPQLHDSTWWAKHTHGMDFTHPDRVNSQAYNAVLEYGITGRGNLPPQAALLSRSAGDGEGD